MVAVEDGDQLAVGLGERVVQVAGLGMVVVGPHDVAHAHGLGELAEFLAPAVVQDEDLDLVLGPVQRHGGQHRGAHHAQRLVVGGDVHVHRGPRCRHAPQFGRAAVQRPGGLDEAQHHHQPGVGLGGQQAIAEEGLDDRVELDGRRDAPPGIAAHGQQADGGEGQRRVAPRQAAQHQRQAPAQQHEQGLPEPVEGRGHHDQAGHHAHGQHGPAQSGDLQGGGQHLVGQAHAFSHIDVGGQAVHGAQEQPDRPEHGGQQQRQALPAPAQHEAEAGKQPVQRLQQPGQQGALRGGGQHHAAPQPHPPGGAGCHFELARQPGPRQAQPCAGVLRSRGVSGQGRAGIGLRRHGRLAPATSIDGGAWRWPVSQLHTPCKSWADWAWGAKLWTHIARASARGMFSSSCSV